MAPESGRFRGADLDDNPYKAGPVNHDIDNPCYPYQHTVRPLGRRILPYALLSPAVLVTLSIVFFPMVQAMWMSLHDYVLFRPKEFNFVGLKNFIAALQDEVFWISFRNTVLWIGLTVPAQLLLGLATALLINQKFFWRPVARALIIIPWALPSVVIALMWVWIYDSNYGILNELLLRAHIIKSSIPWLARADTALYAIIVTLTWQGFPFFAIMLLAGLQAIPNSYYEAASIDGASKWRQFWHITLPGISGVILTAVLLRTIWVANSIDVIFVMTGGGPGYATYTLPLYAFVKARTGLDFGAGTTIAVLFTIMLLGVVIFYVRRTGEETR